MAALLCESRNRHPSTNGGIWKHIDSRKRNARAGVSYDMPSIY